MAEPMRADRIAGRALSPRAFRTFGIEAVVLGPASQQEGLVRREGVAVWRRLAEHAPVFDRAAAAAGGATVGEDGVLPVRVVVAATPSRDRAMRVPALGERAARVLELAGGPPPSPGWLLLVDEGPGEVWLYLADEADPRGALDGFLGRRGRTDFGRALRRSRVGRLASLGVFAALVLIIYGQALGLGAGGQVVGVLALLGSLAWLVAARPR
jgi:hypothetical protein